VAATKTMIERTERRLDLKPSMYRRGQLVLVLSHEDDQWHDGIFLDYVDAKCRVLWEEVEPGQFPAALVDPGEIKER
jgi:hypothetical protein